MNECGKTGAPRGTNNFDTDDDTMFALKLQQAYAMCKADAADKQMCIQTKNLYFAGPWFDERADKLYDFCKRVVDYDKAITPYNVFFPKYCAANRPFDVFVNNVAEVRAADTVVALVSCKDVGTAWEIGMAYSLHKKLILLGYDETTFLSHTNAMLAFCAECATISDLTKILLDEKYSNIIIPNQWEGIE